MHNETLSRSDARVQSKLFVIRVCNDDVNVIETHEHKGECREA